MIHNGSADDEFRQLKDAERAALKASKKSAEAEAKLKEARARYAAARPLTEEERDAVIAHVASGGALCCEAGREWLLEHLPEPWARSINAWAYEHLGCPGANGDEFRTIYAERVRDRLVLDRLWGDD